MPCPYKGLRWAQLRSRGALVVETRWFARETKETSQASIEEAWGQTNGHAQILCGR